MKRLLFVIISLFMFGCSDSYFYETTIHIYAEDVLFPGEKKDCYEIEYINQISNTTLLVAHNRSYEVLREMLTTINGLDSVKYKRDSSLRKVKLLINTLIKHEKDMYNMYQQPEEAYYFDVLVRSKVDGKRTRYLFVLNTELTKVLTVNKIE